MRPRRVGVCPWMCVGMCMCVVCMRTCACALCASYAHACACFACMHACMLHVHVHVRASKCACTRNGLEVSMIEPRAPYCVEVNAVLAPPRPLPLPLPV